MRKKIVFIYMFLIACIVPSFADSMLSSSPIGEEDGLVFIGENNERDSDSANLNEEVLYVTLRKKVEKIWGPEVVAKKEASAVDAGIAYVVPKNCPNIYVTYKVRVYNPKYNKVSSKLPYKYKHKYSSRHKKYIYRVKKVNITPIVFREAKRYKISPALLLAVIQTESNFNNYAVSHAGALGLCQLMPKTAKYLGVKNPFNPEENIRAGARYLSMLIKMFKDIDLVLAAYNAGPGTVSRTKGIPNIYETRRYVKKVKRNMAKWKKIVLK